MVHFWIAKFFVCFILFQMAAGECCPGAANGTCMVKDNIVRLATGRPAGDIISSLTVGPNGPVLLQDITLFERLAHLARERIPVRVAHPKGNGAFGYFEVTDDITKYSKAKVFSEVGKRTPIAVRFSLADGEIGEPDTIRDLRGYAIKFYTDEGNWDLLGLNTPVFPIRDAMRFPSFTHSLRKNPRNNLPDENALWDFASLRPESTAAMTYLNTDRGLPLNYRNMDGFAINVFKLVNADGEAVHCKFTYLNEQGSQNLLSKEAEKLAGSDPDNFGKDLFNAIERGEYPSWTLYIQVMTLDQARNVTFNSLDATKEWPVEEFPLIRVGKLVLNRNPNNFFAEVEQLAFCPSNLVPGIEPSPDKLLQGRLFAYLDTQRYRLGINHKNLPPNCPFRSPAHNYERDGSAVYTDNGGPGPIYYPNSFGGPVEDPEVREYSFQACGEVNRYDNGDEDNFSQARIYYQRLDDGGKQRLVENIAKTLSKTEPFIQERQLDNFRQVHPSFAKRLTKALAQAKE